MMNGNFGIWSKRKGLEWDQDFNWKFYEEIDQWNHPLYALAKSKTHPIQIEIADFVQSKQNIYLKKITLFNESKENQELTLFFEQDFEREDGTAFFSLSNRSLYHEYEDYYLLFNGLLDEKGISQYTTWQKNDIQNNQLINIENGSLFFNPIAEGNVKSAFSLETTLLPFEIKHGYYWTVFGENLNEVEKLNELVKRNPEWLICDNIEMEEVFKKMVL